MRKETGFSLIELLIVVAIILIIAAIAIPNLMRSKMAANEASAVEHIRTLNTFESTYASANPECGYTDLPGLVNSGLIDDNALGNGSKSGYLFNIVATGGSANCATPNSAHQITASPMSPQTGTRYFLSDPSGVIRYKVGSPATNTSPPI
jgi:prepilin-type N-terminal cleavage/methylation domain-containing protein